MNNQNETNSSTSPDHGNNIIIASNDYLDDLLKGSGSRSMEIREIERELQKAEDRLATVNNSSSNKTEQINLGFKEDSNGNEIRLSFSEKTKLKKEKRILTSSKRKLKTEVTQLNKKYSSLCRLDANKERRAAVRKSASKDSYHRNNGEAIRTAITNWVGVMDTTQLETLKGNLTEATGVRADATIMKALLKAPRNLHARVVANSTTRFDYLAHFKEQLV